MSEKPAGVPSVVIDRLREVLAPDALVLDESALEALERRKRQSEAATARWSGAHGVARWTFGSSAIWPRWSTGC